MGPGSPLTLNYQMCVGIIVVSSLLAFVALSKKGHEYLVFKPSIENAALLFAFSIGGGLYASALAGGAQASIPKWLAVLTTVWAGTASAIYLFALRRDDKKTYGFIEVGIGIILLLVATQSTTENTLIASSVAFLSGVYVIVRGLTNVSETPEKPEPEEPTK